MIAVVLLALTSCRGDASGPTTTLLHFEGAIHDAATEGPIPDAQIILQWPAGAFGTGTEWAETDAEGHYTLMRDFGGQSFSCNGFGMTAQAEGYQSQFVLPGEVRCTSDVQIFDFDLEPGG